MKTLKWSLLVILIAGVSVLTLRTRSPRPLVSTGHDVVNVNQQNWKETKSDGAISQPPPFASTPVRTFVPASSTSSEKPDASITDIVSPPMSTIRVRADRVLAKVNGKAILLKDLGPVRADEQELAMTLEEYESRLNRAIEMELTFKAAAARGVDLTPEQKKRVDGVAQRHEATLQEYRKQGVTWSSLTAAQLEFERRLTSALMLQQNLAATEARVAPASDPAVQARYEQARSEVISRLKAQGNISVSSTEL